jgi:hypothetical protein
MQTEAINFLSVFGGEVLERPFVRVVYQKGLPDQVGINGCRVEDVIRVAAAKLEDFQCGMLVCEENEAALRHLYAAIDALEMRLRRREQQGVLNTMYNHSSVRTEDLEYDFSATGA